MSHDITPVVQYNAVIFWQRGPWRGIMPRGWAVMIWWGSGGRIR